MDVYRQNLSIAAAQIISEVQVAKMSYPDNFHSPHEGYGVILEEVDELWDECKAKNFDKDKARKEAIQAAAMLLRFIVELT